MEWRAWCCLVGACALPAQGPAGLEEQVNAALDRARPRLLDLAQRHRGGELVLVCLALVDDEALRDDGSVRRALERLEGAELNGTYELGLRLMVMAELADYPDRERAAARDLRRLLRNQTPFGGFGYGPEGSNWDLSNTQYGALGMRAAVSLGCSIKQIHWQRLRRAAEHVQQASGGFSYRPEAGATPSMTVAGIGVLEVCLQYLQGRGAAEKVGQRIQRGWSWMEANVGAIGRPEPGHAYYFHYGLERAAILSGITRVGDVDWYEAGAKLLLAEQGAAGGWSPHGGFRPANRDADAPPDAVATSFAVLFLRRHFQRRLGPTTDAGGLLTRGLPDGATEEQVARAVELDVGRGLRAVPDLLKALRSPIVARRRAAALGLAKISGRDFGLEPYRDPAATADAIKAAEVWWLSEGRRALEERRWP